MDVVRNKKSLAQAILSLRSQGKTIGFVPTMGALHAGHISLIELTRKHADAAVASVFVNPTQFGPNEDFSRYPRTEEADLDALAAAGVCVAYLPTVEEMYPGGAVTRVMVKGISDELCGAFRPGHFEGVATVVTKLLLQALPDVAVFGEKDYQQLHIIRQAVRDLDVPVEILGAPILREPDGLALSSRNRYLSEGHRTIAAMLYRTLQENKALFRENVQNALARAKEALITAGFSSVDYVELRDAASLAHVVAIEKPARLLAAAHLGTTRLIDNLEVLPA